MNLELKIWVEESEDIMSGSSDFLQQIQSVNLDLLSALPEIDEFISQITSFLNDIIDDIIAFIDQLIEGLDWLVPEIKKMHVVIKMLLASARTFTGLLEASVSINTSTGTELMNYSGHAGFADKMNQVLAFIEDFTHKMLPDDTLIDGLKKELEKAKDILQNIQSNLNT